MGSPDVERLSWMGPVHTGRSSREGWAMKGFAGSRLVLEGPVL